jgi:hypothetical protein
VDRDSETEVERTGVADRQAQRQASDAGRIAMHPQSLAM